MGRKFLCSVRTLWKAPEYKTDFVICGSIDGLPNKIAVTLKMVNVKTKSIEKSAEIETLFSSCFPDGLYFRIIPRCAIEGAERLGWIGRKSDRYQIHSVSSIFN